MTRGMRFLRRAADRLLVAVGLGPDTDTFRPSTKMRSGQTLLQPIDPIQSSPATRLSGSYQLHQKKARDVMRPRTEIVALPVDASSEELLRVVRSERYSRYPVYRDGLDDVIGVFLAKDLWLHDPTKPFVLADHVRKAPYVPDTRLAERVMDDLRRSKAHMAIVLDEYGGTSGILTLEDLIEEVIGEIQDEYDFATNDVVRADGVLELAGELPLVDVRTGYGLDIPDGDWNTLGGFVFGELGRLAKMGDRVVISTGELEVVAMDGRRVAAVRVHVKTPAHGMPAVSDRQVPL